MSRFVFFTPHCWNCTFLCSLYFFLSAFLDSEKRRSPGPPTTFFFIWMLHGSTKVVVRAERASSGASGTSGWSNQEECPSLCHPPSFAIYFGSRRPSVRTTVSNKLVHALFLSKMRLQSLEPARKHLVPLGSLKSFQRKLINRLLS